MGNNAAFTQFEQTVIQLADAGKLDKETLEALAAPYAGTDIDEGGRKDLLTQSGKDIGEVCVLVYYPDFQPTIDYDWYDAWSDIQWDIFGWR